MEIKDFRELLEHKIKNEKGLITDKLYWVKKISHDIEERLDKKNERTFMNGLGEYQHNAANVDIEIAKLTLLEELYEKFIILS
jgi:hypothetical protein